MIDRFPHAPAAVANTLAIAEACLRDWDFNRLVFPCFEKMDDREAFDRLYRMTLEGCRRRYGGITPAVKQRIDHEMRIIREKNFAHYFLVVADITRQAQRSCGRGSAAASIVAYALEITHVDPIRHNLFFERFLNPGRMDPPDIDVDFAWDERERIIDYVFARYGNRRAAMVANHNTFGARSAIREVARAFGLTDREIGDVTRKIGYGWHLKKTRDGLCRDPKMRGVPFKKPWDEILDTAVRLEDHFNHLSTHCGGLVMVPDEIRRYCPVEISASGLQVLQWEKDSVEDAGLVKIDILGNRSLAVIRDALALVEKKHGPPHRLRGAESRGRSPGHTNFLRRKHLRRFLFREPRHPSGPRQGQAGHRLRGIPPHGPLPPQRGGHLHYPARVQPQRPHVGVPAARGALGPAPSPAGARAGRDPGGHGVPGAVEPGGHLSGRVRPGRGRDPPQGGEQEAPREEAEGLLRPFCGRGPEPGGGRRDHPGGVGDDDGV